MREELLARLRLFAETVQRSASDFAVWAGPVARDLAGRGASGTRDAAARIRGAVEAWDKSDALSGQEDPLRGWRRDARRHFTTVGVFSLFVSILMLTLPIYLFQISDRVLTSRSFDTLLMLSLLALAFLTVLSLLDVFRRQVLGSLATQLDTRLGGPLLASVISSSLVGGGNVQTLRSLHQVRNFISSPAMLLLFDTPLAPVYFAVVFLISPTLGFIVLTSGMVLMASPGSTSTPRRPS
jgi:ATP-binding cassette subfamily C protein